MLDYLKFVVALISIVPSLIGIIKAVELPGSGADKAATVTGLVVEAFKIVPPEIVKQIGLDKVESYVRKAIELVVNFLNKVGVFNARPVS